MLTSEYSALDCPSIMPLVVERPTNWTFNKVEIAPNCPRCASSNTKFCYYNNYSFSQPRYFCKSCRRYWTKGGSLRNVPVGGGCRKSRRSRAARQGAGTNYPAPSSNQDVGSTNTSEGGTEIDMAAVFAKYVNPNSDREDSFSPGASSESSENVTESSFDVDVDLMFEYQDQVDWMNGTENQVIPEMSMCVNDQDFVYQNSEAFDMQGTVVGDGQVGDILWSDHTNMQNFGSDLQLQDFGLFASEDQFRSSGENVACENWSSFDLSAYEIY